MSVQERTSADGAAAFRGDDGGPQIHADFTAPANLDTGAMAWEASPAAGVWRKRLERIGTERPRLTTLVRFEPGSRFERHGHPGGEEFLVLSGTFSDASGDFTAGTYVRNPRTWDHAPWTREGCDLFVKLCQFQRDDAQRVVIDSLAARWVRTGRSGVQRLTLHVHGEEQVALYRFAAGTAGRGWNCPDGAEILVLEGVLDDGAIRRGSGAWLRLPRGSRPQLGSASGCRIYCKTGNLYP